MSNNVSGAKFKSCVTMALLSMILLSPALPWTMGTPSSIWVIYDRDDPDVGYSGADDLAVRFTPPRIWLGMGKTCTLFRITAIRLYLYCDSQSAGFDVYVTDENHQVIKSFLNLDPEVDGWYDLDLAGWTGYVDTHFFVEFAALPPSPNLQESWAILWFDEAVVDEGEASYGRSYRYTYGPDNPNVPAWLPIELTYPYGPGDLMIRVELEPQGPEMVLPKLRDAVFAADNLVFKGYEDLQPRQVKAVLIKKINEAILMFEKGNYGAGLNKLLNDIGRKLADPRPTPLADPRPTPQTSWLTLYPEGSGDQKTVTAFAVACQEIIQNTKSAIPVAPVLPDRVDFNGDGYDDLAIGVPDENIGGKDDAGAVNVLYGSVSGISAVGDDYWHQDVSGVKGDCDAHDRFGGALAIGDFNRDGFDDLAIGVPGEEANYIETAGAVNVLYGCANGLTADDDQLWSQSSEGVGGACEEGDYFGSSLVAGDFDGDGYDDLAIGVFGEDISDIDDAGAVNVLYGSPSGLSATGNQLWSQESEGIGGTSELSDCFGAALTVGDFNGDGFEDLAIGVPNEEIEGKDSAGAVNLLYGSAMGLTAVGSQIWYQDSMGILDESEWWDHFGASLAAGDYNGDGYDDLAVGVPNESILWTNGYIADAGVVHIIVGSSIGLSSANDQIIDQGLWGGECEEGDCFGASLATGDFDQDGYEDLAVGAPFEDYYDVLWETTVLDAGAFSSIYGCSLGLKWSTHNKIWFDEEFHMGTSEEDDCFGKTLSTGDFNGDGYYDLAVGVPGQTVYIEQPGHRWHPMHDTGMVYTIYGSPDDGLWYTGFQTWDQSVSGVEGTCDDFDHFGSSLPGSFWSGV